MGSTKTIRVGDIAPDFTLQDQHNRQFRLADFKRKRVVLSFHPLAWTPVCGEQMKALEAHKAGFDKLESLAVGVSVDTFPSKHAWAKELGIKDTRLLCDFWPHGAVAHALGLFREEEGYSERANVIVDERGRISFIKVYDIAKLPDLEEVFDFLGR